MDGMQTLRNSMVRSIYLASSNVWNDWRSTRINLASGEKKISYWADVLQLDTTTINGEMEALALSSGGILEIIMVRCTILPVNR